MIRRTAMIVIGSVAALAFSASPAKAGDWGVSVSFGGGCYNDGYVVYDNPCYDTGYVYAPAPVVYRDCGPTVYYRSYPRYYSYPRAYSTYSYRRPVIVNRGWGGSVHYSHRGGHGHGGGDHHGYYRHR